MRVHSCRQYILLHDHAVTDTHCTTIVVLLCTNSEPLGLVVRVHRSLHYPTVPKHEYAVCGHTAIYRQSRMACTTKCRTDSVRRVAFLPQIQQSCTCAIKSTGVMYSWCYAWPYAAASNIYVLVHYIVLFIFLFFINR